MPLHLCAALSETPLLLDELYKHIWHNLTCWFAETNTALCFLSRLEPPVCLLIILPWKEDDWQHDCDPACLVLLEWHQVRQQWQCRGSSVGPLAIHQRSGGRSSGAACHCDVPDKEGTLKLYFRDFMWLLLPLWAAWHLHSVCFETPSFYISTQGFLMNLVCTLFVIYPDGNMALPWKNKYQQLQCVYNGCPDSTPDFQTSGVTFREPGISASMLRLQGVSCANFNHQPPNEPTQSQNINSFNASLFWGSIPASRGSMHIFTHPAFLFLSLSLPVTVPH